MFNIVIEWLTNNWCTLHEYFVITMELLNCHIDRTIHKVCITLSNIWQSFSRPFCLTLQAGLLERFGENFRGGPSNELRESDEPAHDRAIEFWIPHVHWQTQQSNCLKVTGINRQHNYDKNHGHAALTLTYIIMVKSDSRPACTTLASNAA